jgi:hypothetical protein
MWHKNFEDRLTAWHQLRSRVASLPIEQALSEINTWWFDTPWMAYHLHWDDRATWPDPWQLLDDNLFCPLARGLGILYTITLLDRADLADTVLVDTGADNLVLVDKKKYILNWDRQQVLNINLGQFSVRHSVSQEQIKNQIK